MRKIAFVFLFLYILSSVQAEKFKHLNEDMGLSSRRCYSIRQDAKGFTWISTKLSVDRYDGHDIVRYELLSPGQPAADNIGFNFVTLSPDSSVWAFTQPGAVYRYDELTDAFIYVYSIREYYKSYSIVLNDIFFENENTLLLATGKGILKLNLTTKEVTNCDIMNDKDVCHILKHQDNYFFSTRTGLFIVRYSVAGLDKITAHILPDFSITRVFYEPKFQQFWIGTFSNGIYILPKREGMPLVHVLPDVIKPVRAILQYNEEQMAVGIDGEGIMLVNRYTLKKEGAFLQQENVSTSLCGNSIWDLLLDKQKILWVATYHEGISYTDQSNLNFNSFVHEGWNENSLSNNYANTVLEDRDGDLWFGTNDGLSLLYRKTGKWKHFFRENPSSESVILTLCENTDGKIWAGGYAFGVAEIDKRNGLVKRYHSGNNSVTGTEHVYSIYKDEYADNLWLGGIHGNISSYDPKTGDTRFYDNENVRCFSSCSDSVILLGLYRGLYKLDKATGEKYATKINSSVNDIFKAGDKEYWVGTMINGLYYYDMKNDSIRRYTKESDGLSSNHVYSIRQDEEGFLWISTESGLNKFNPATGEVIIFDKQDGLISNQFVQHSSARCSSSELLFGTADGAVIFYPSEISKSNIKEHYPLVLSEFHLFNQPVKPGRKGSPLQHSFNNTEKIVLPHNQNYFSLTFTMPNYQSSDKTEYVWLLKDYDIDWSVPSTYNTASYSKIQPGNYTFYVRAYIDKQLQEERQLYITVLQPWWNTSLAWIVYILLVVILMVLLANYYTERTRKKAAQEKVDFFINTAHDILTPLSLIESPLKDISMMDNLTEEVKYLCSLALNNARKLSHFVHQLIDFQRITLNAESLVVSKHNIHDFFINKANMYRTVASQKFITMNVIVPDAEKEILFDKEKVSKVIDNLLSNAIKYTPYGGEISISASFGENRWSFKVKDSGMGIPRKDQKHIFKYMFRSDNDVNVQNVGSGVGLKMVSALVNIHKGKVSFNSKKNQGAEFIISLPYEFEEKYIDKSDLLEINPEYSQTTEKQNANLMVIEYEPEMADYLRNTFSKEFNTETFASGNEALSRIKVFHPQLIIIDVSINDMDAFTFCKKIKDNPDTSFIPLIVISDASDPDTVKKVFSCGASDFIKKPFDVEVLKLKVSNLLALQETWQNKALSEIKMNNVTAVNNGKDQEFMDNLIQLIEKNIDNPELNIAMLCRELALSRTLLYNKITQLTDHSPNEFIRIVRLKYAANLLISGKYSIAEVSTMIGIDNPKYFSRIFKDYYKVSPKNYLK